MSSDPHTGATPVEQTVEQVVLLDESGSRAVGVAAKRDVHHQQTPLHLAFSCYLFDPEGRLLVTRRARHKKTWPGVWTNTACGHPAPGEHIFDAVRRRCGDELGVTASHLTVLLPSFRYEATMANGVRENEVCPVLTAVTTDRPQPDPDEVDAIEWVPWPAFRDDVLSGRRDVSPWCVAQVRQLASQGPDPLQWAPGDWSQLPPPALGGSSQV